MKKSIIIFFIIFSFQTTFHLKAQHRYLADSPTWIVSSSCNPYPCYSKTSNIYYYLKGDTTIGNYSYHKVFKKEFGQLICPGPGASTYFGSNDTVHPVAYLRDTLKQIRQWNEFLNVDALLYNFDLNVGDTVPNSAYGFTIVDSIDSIPVSNYFRKRFKLSNPYCTNYLYEGIGNFNGFLEPVVCINVSEDCSYTLTCYGFNDTAWYPTVDALYPCIIPPIPLAIEEHKQPMPSSEISIYPNPNNGKFEVVKNDLKFRESYTFEIYDIRGGLIFQSTTANKKLEIDLTNQAKGIYFIKMNHGETFLSKKIVIR